MKYHVNEKRAIGKRSPMLYGHFIEHFHRQIYDGIYDPGNKLSDEEGFRKDIIEAMKKNQSSGFCAGRVDVLYLHIIGKMEWEKTDNLFLIKHGVWRIRIHLEQMNTFICVGK